MASESAKEAVRRDFNPSGSTTVATIKELTSELVTLMETIRDDKAGHAGREAAIAITNIQTASMWCVLAATKGL